MSPRKKVIEYMKSSAKMIEILDNENESLWEDNNLLKAENKKLKEGKSSDHVMDETEIAMLNQCFEQLNRTSKRLERRTNKQSQRD